MTKKFIPQMRALFISAGYDMKDEGDAATHDSEFIISVQGVLYPIYEDYSWDREDRNIYVSGSGGDVALGVLEALNYHRINTPKAAEKALRRAVEIAIKHDIYSGGKIVTHVQEH
jgi:ATP-dependent protease HslVU (ClpYQ) peptidase subunit